MNPSVAFVYFLALTRPLFRAREAGRRAAESVRLLKQPACLAKDGIAESGRCGQTDRERDAGKRGDGGVNEYLSVLPSRVGCLRLLLAERRRWRGN